MVAYNSKKEASIGYFQKFFGRAYKGKKISDEEIIFYREDYDFLLNPQKWRKIEFPETNLLAKIFDDKTLYSADNILFVQRIFSPHYVKEGSLIKLHDISQKRFRNLKIEEPIGFKLKGEDGFLYHLYSGGVALDGISKKMSQEIKMGLTKLLAKSTRTLHKNNILYYMPLSFPLSSHELSSDIRYDLESKIIYSPHQLMEFKRVTANDGDRELAYLLYDFDWIDLQGTVEFIRSYLGGGTNENTIDRQIQSIRKKGVEIHGLCLKLRGIFYLTEKESKIAQKKQKHISLMEDRIAKKIQENEKKKILEDYLAVND